MARRVGDLLAQRATESFVGRRDELASLLASLEDDSPLVVQVHGLAGVGKSALLEVFSSKAKERGFAVVCLDCRTIEPTARGFLHELERSIGGHKLTIEAAAERLERLGSRVVLALDTYELLHLLDTWLRQVFVPQLGDNVRVVLSGRLPPAPTWLVAPEWQGLFRSIPLGPLSDDEALAQKLSQELDELQRMIRLFQNHPAYTAPDNLLDTVWHQLAHTAE